MLCYYAFQLDISALICIGVFGAITFFYAIPFLPKKIFLDEQQNLRQVSGLKIYVIAFVWACVTVVLPLVSNVYSLTVDVYITALQRFLFVIVLMLPFEIRDLQYDSLKLATIPQRIGIKKTKVIGVLLLLLFFMLEYFKDETSSETILILAIVMLITLLFLSFSNKSRNWYYSAFWVESIPVIWLLLTLFF